MKRTRRGVTATIVAALSCAALVGCKDGAMGGGQEPSLMEPPEQEPRTDPPEAEPPPEVETPRGPMLGRSPMRLLTRYEYDNTIREVLGLQMRPSLAFPPENRVNGFENNAWTHNVSPPLLRHYIEASEQISAQAVAEQVEPLGSCLQGDIDRGGGVSGWARRADRAGLSAPDAPNRSARSSTSSGAPSARSEGAEVATLAAVQSILQSPQFLYRLELYEPSPQDMDPQPRDHDQMDMTTYELVGPYEMASRLSYFLWASPPDQELMEAAERGDLNTPQVLRAQIDRMLGGRSRPAHGPSVPPAVAGAGQARLDRQGRRRCSRAWEQGLTEDWRISLNAFIDHAYWEEGTLDAFLTSSVVYVTPTMAPLYGLEAQPEAGGLRRVELPDGQRAGILTQPGLMAMLSYPNQSSPIERALFVRERLLCQHLPPPPSDIQIEAPDPRPGATTREIFAELTSEKECAGCHMLINPLGFGFEGYDPMGRWRDTQEGKPVDVSGELVGLPGHLDQRALYVGAVELSERLATSEPVEACIAKQWYTFAMGRPHDASDDPSLEAVKAAFAKDRRFDDLLRSIVLSDAFRFRLDREASAARAERRDEQMTEEAQ